MALYILYIIVCDCPVPPHGCANFMVYEGQEFYGRGFLNSFSINISGVLGDNRYEETTA